jgi:starch-binding outer membrane protein, SusD/RagB family
MKKYKLHFMKKRLLICPQIVAIVIAILLGSCKDVFNLEPESSVDKSQMYRNLSDADAAVMGVYAKFLDIADEYVILNELRADLIDVTNNADNYLREINNHAVSAGNTYANPRPFYTVILNCNDVLKNFAKMRQNSLLTEAEYNQRYSDITAVRCWIYLQLAVHFGEVPYVTVPFEKVSDLSDESLYPKVSLTNMIDTLINTMNILPYLDAYPTTASLMGITSGTYNTTPFFINKRILLGDLNLWKGNYLQAATNYKMVLDLVPTSDYQKFRMCYADVTTHNDVAIGYWQRYQPNNINGLIDSDLYGWRSIFCRTQDRLYYFEQIWQLFFDPANNKNSPFIELFANYGQGKYLLKPSQQVIDYWNSQTQNNGFPYDARGVLSYTTRNGDPIVRKYLYEYDALAPYSKPGRMFLYRAAGLHLHYIEAANRDNKCKLALALLNTGIRHEFSPYWYSGNDTVSNITDLERTTGAIYGYSYPYDFDARVDAGTFNNYRPSGSKIIITQYPVGIKQQWQQNVGVRGRASVKPVLLNMYNPMAITIDNTDALKDSIENYVITEDALELAFEGERWSDLLRIAIRRDDPSFLANKIYDKLKKAGNPNAEAVKEKLNNRNWFLPFSLK